MVTRIPCLEIRIVNVPNVSPNLRVGFEMSGKKPHWTEYGDVVGCHYVVEGTGVLRFGIQRKNSEKRWTDVVMQNNKASIALYDPIDTNMLLEFNIVVSKCDFNKITNNQPIQSSFSIISIGDEPVSDIQPWRLYLSCCHVFGIRLNSGIIKCLKESLQFNFIDFIDLTDVVLGNNEKSLLPLVYVLSSLRYIRILILDGTDIGDIAIDLLCMMIPQTTHPHLHTLSVSGCQCFESAGISLLRFAKSHPKLIHIRYEGNVISPYLVTRLEKVICMHAKDDTLIRTPGEFSSPEREILLKIWNDLIAEPYVEPKDAEIGVKFEIFMKTISNSMSEYRDSGVRAIFAAYIDKCPAKEKIATSSDISFRSSIYSALCLGIYSITNPSSDSSAVSVLSQLGVLFHTFGVRDFHLSLFITHSVNALKSCGISIDEETANVWKAALQLISDSLIPSKYKRHKTAVEGVQGP